MWLMDRGQTAFIVRAGFYTTHEISQVGHEWIAWGKTPANAEPIDAW